MTQEYFPDGWTKDKTFIIHYNYSKPHYLITIEPPVIVNIQSIKIDGHSVKTHNNLYLNSILEKNILSTNDLTLLIKFIKQHKISSNQLMFSHEIGQIIDLVNETDGIFAQEDLCQNN